MIVDVILIFEVILIFDVVFSFEVYLHVYAFFYIILIFLYFPHLWGLFLFSDTNFIFGDHSYFWGRQLHHMISSIPKHGKDQACKTKANPKLVKPLRQKCIMNQLAQISLGKVLPQLVFQYCFWETVLVNVFRIQKCFNASWIELC